MSSDKIKSWEVLLADAIGEDAALRILYDTATRPLRWLTDRADGPTNGEASRRMRKR
jgi:hypothetical protein